MGNSSLPSPTTTSLNESSSNLIGILQPRRFAQLFGGASVVVFWGSPSVTTGGDLRSRLIFKGMMFLFFEWGPSPFLLGFSSKKRFLIKFVVLKKKKPSNIWEIFGHQQFEASKMPRRIFSRRWSVAGSFNPWDAHIPKHGSRRRNYHLHKYWPDTTDTASSMQGGGREEYDPRRT